MLTKEIKKIVSKVNPGWNKLQIIRFVYLELGKYLEKNTDYFLNDKLDKMSLSKEEMDAIYHEDKVFRIKRNNLVQYQIICKSASLILQQVYSTLGIDSYLIRTLHDSQGIYHWFLVAIDDDNKQYFLSLTADLPYIKNELPTMHFANNISYYNPDGEPNYVLPNNTNLTFKPITHIDNDGNRTSGYEIDHKVFTNGEVAQKELELLDKSIGYGHLYENKKLLEGNPFNKLFWEIAETKSEVYRIFYKCFAIKKGHLYDFKYLTIKKYGFFKEELKAYIESLILEKTKNNQSDDIIKDYLIHCIEVKEEDKELSSLKLLNKYKNDFKKVSNDNLLAIIKSFLSIIEHFENYFMVKSRYQKLEDKVKHFNKSSTLDEASLQEDIIDSYWDLQKAKKSIKASKLTLMLNHLAFLTMKEKIEYSKDEYVSLEQIVTRFEMLFPAIFDCNYDKEHTLSRNAFSIQNYSEQIVIVKMMLRKMFSDLTEENCKNMEDYNDKYSPVDNRIQTFPLKNRITGEYCIGFRFGAMASENSVEFIYIPSENILRRRDPLKDSVNYWIVSERFNDRLQRIERI